MVQDDSSSTQQPKRQRLLLGDSSSTTEEVRAAFEEDMAQIRSALGSTGDGTQSNSNTNNTGNIEAHPFDDANLGERRMEEPHQDAPSSSSSSFHARSEDEGGSERHNHRGLGNDNNNNGGGGDDNLQQRNSIGDNDDDSGNWLKNYTPHHTRIGPNYQVTDLPTVMSSSSLCRPANNSSAVSAVQTSCVSPGEG